MAVWDELLGKFVSAPSRYCNVKEDEFSQEDNTLTSGL